MASSRPEHREHPPPWFTAERPRIGISACLLGKPVRYDGGHKRDPFLTETFGQFVEWVPVCPEVELGLGVPRPTLRLEADETGVRLRVPSTGADLTAAMQRWADKKLRALAGEQLSGFVVKKDSPSCGMERVRVYQGSGAPRRGGTGLFTAALRAAWPLLPVEEEGRLHDPRLRENFVERVFAYQRLQRMFRGRWSVGQVVAFHTAHKLQLLAHSPRLYRELGQLVAHVREFSREEFRARYAEQFMRALQTLATPARHTNVLQHMMGYLREHIDGEARAELVQLIGEYRRGLVPLVVPLTLLNHFVRRHRIAYLLGQTYLEPHPRELMLRNHV
ncbi:MAG: DUF523 and DUF1722 domain-containing protein [Candidatus Binatia bacterium]|nr:DUF523 and DUF1722 domain-containing protein [Candidatus Binatia bacterium]